MSAVPQLLDFSDVEAHPLARMRARVLAFILVLGIVGQLALIVLDLQTGGSIGNNAVSLACLSLGLILIHFQRLSLAVFCYLIPATAEFFRAFLVSGGVESHALPLFFLLIVVAVHLLRPVLSIPFVALLLLGLNLDLPLALSTPSDAPGREAALGKRFVVIDAIAIAITAVFALVWYWLNRYFRELLRHTRHLDALVRERTRQLATEKERSERLLQNILPESIAERLKDEGERPVDRFDDASVLFADIVGFTPLSRTRTPDQIVDVLNAIFSRFDALVASRGLEKIKTIGDEYMVAGGLPEACSGHLEALADLALEMRAAFEAGIPGAEGLKIRIGLSAGPVVAGVIGCRKFHYDLWGETVNLASRMESTGQPGRIHLPATVAERLTGSHRLEPRGTLAVKGVGLVDTCFLVERRAHDAEAA